jgi:hypothetical protein
VFEKIQIAGVLGIRKLMAVYEAVKVGLGIWFKRIARPRDIKL